MQFTSFQSVSLILSFVTKSRSRTIKEHGHRFPEFVGKTDNNNLREKNVHRSYVRHKPLV